MISWLWGIFVRCPPLAPKTQVVVITFPESCPLKWTQLQVPHPDGRLMWKVLARVGGRGWKAELGEGRVATWGLRVSVA